MLPLLPPPGSSQGETQVKRRHKVYSTHIEHPLLVHTHFSLSPEPSPPPAPRPPVRDICVLSIHSLGGWLQAYPSLFLADTFTKYLGWSLYAKEAPIRAHSPPSLRKPPHDAMGPFGSRWSAVCPFHNSCMLCCEPAVCHAEVKTIKHHSKFYRIASHSILFEYTKFARTPPLTPHVAPIRLSLLE